MNLIHPMRALPIYGYLIPIRLPPTIPTWEMSSVRQDEPEIAIGHADSIIPGGILT